VRAQPGGITVSTFLYRLGRSSARHPFRVLGLWLVAAVVVMSAQGSAGGAFKVRRGEADTDAIAMAVSLVQEGHLVVMFPEGTRREKGLRKKYEARWHTGAARIALEAGVPLVPAAIAGTDRIARLAPLRVAYGTPIALDDLRDRAAKDAAAEATDRLRAEIERLEATL